MVGIVAVSHSQKLAEAALELALDMVQDQHPRIAVAAGAADGTFGTDATKVATAIHEVADDDGVVVICDLGSALMSAEMGIELSGNHRARLIHAPFIEGVFAAIVNASLGADLDTVAQAASAAISPGVDDTAEEVPHATEVADALAAVTLKNPLGLHARPAAKIAETAAPFLSRVWISSDSTARVRAVSPIAVIGLGARQGDTLWILATGPDADDAVHALQMLIEQGFGEEVAQTTGEINLALAAHRGVGLSPGRVVGQVLHALSDLEAPKSADPLPEDAREADAQRIPRAAYHVAADLRERAAEARDAASRQVLEATAVLAEDRMLHEDAMSRVRLLGETAERAVWEMLSAIALQYERQGDVLAERASDVRDLRSRIVAQLQDTEVTTVPITTLPHILVANDIPPVDAAGLDPRICLGLVLGQGGPTSHSTIIARSLGIPVVIHPQAVATVQNDVTILIDGSTGELLSKPGEAEIATARTTPLILADLEPVHDPVLLTDGHRVPLLGNIGGIEDAKRARERGAVGVGLFRTEYLFLQDAEAPDTEEQTRAYAEVLEEFQGQKVIFRTLDVGSDKSLPFLPRPEETNSALGVRGIRTAQPNPELLETQLHAIAAAAHDNPDVEVGVMAPMVTTWKESQDFAALARRCGIDSVGIMVETPAAAVMAQELSEPLSFLSIGTNDLTQYTLAADRLSTQLASLNTPWQPSVLRLIAQTVTGAGDLSVSVCGEAASDPLLAVALIGLGVSELSMTPSVLPVVANALGQVSLDQCRRAALAAQSALSAAAARESVASIVQSA